MRIMLVYSGHGVSTIDVCRGYRKALERSGHKVRSFDYHHYLHFWSTALEAWRSETGAMWDQSVQLRKASEQIVLDALLFQPQAAVIVTGLVLHRIAWEMLYALGVPVLLICTESPYLDENQLQVVKDGKASAVLTNDLSTLADYQAACPHAAYLPHSYDPDVHWPRQVGGSYRSDVFFWGTMYEERERLFDAVDWRRAHVVIRGAKLTMDGHVENAIANEELACFYNGTKVAVNMHRCTVGEREGKLIMLDKPAYSLGPRAYEIAACGAFQVMDDTRLELDAVFGNTMPTFDTAESLGEQVAWWLAHPKERRARAEAQRERVAPCTFERRAQEIVIPMIEQIAV